MERLIYEGRFLVNTVGGIMRQDDLRVMYSRVNCQYHIFSFIGKWRQNTGAVEGTVF